MLMSFLQDAAIICGASLLGLRFGIDVGIAAAFLCWAIAPCTSYHISFKAKKDRYNKSLPKRRLNDPC